MRCQTSGIALFWVGGVSACVAVCMCGHVHGQSDGGGHQHIFLPPAAGATPLSVQIEAQAKYVAAYGDLLESAATARKINAEAVAKEIENSVNYVKAYFERKDINHEHWLKEHPSYVELEKRRQAAFKERMATQYQSLLRGDVTEPLNWLLRELSTQILAYRYIRGEKDSYSPGDRKLSPNDIQQIMLTDGGRKDSRLVFSAADGKPLQMSHWPVALRGDEFAADRERLRQTMEEIAAEISRNHQVSQETRAKGMQDINSLFVVLETAYPRERRKDPAVFTEYSTGKVFLQSSLATLHRATATNNPLAFSGGLRFEGDSVAGLVQHMYESGLEFAPPRPGGEGTYKSLFESLRGLYLAGGADQPVGRQGPPTTE